MKSIFKILVLALIGILAFSCANPMTSSSPTKTSSLTGKFAVQPFGAKSNAVTVSSQNESLINNLVKSGRTDLGGSLSSISQAGKSVARDASSPVTPTVAPSLGSVTVQDSSYILFLLKNVGNAPLYDILVTVTDGGNSSDFTASPGSLPELDTDANVALSPLVQLFINHGQVAGVVGQVNYIPVSVTTANITIYGWSNSDPADHVLANVNNPSFLPDAILQTTVNVNIKTAGWALANSNGVPAIQQSVGAGVYNGTSGGNGLVTFSNTGNTEMKITYYTNVSPAAMASQVVSVGNSFVVPAPIGGTPGNANFTIDTEGVVFDNTINGLQFDTGTSKVDILAQGF